MACFSILTAFPEFFGDFLSTSIVGRAVKNGLLHVDLVNLRDFGKGNYRQIDDYSFGSGGMVLAAPVLKNALDFISGAYPDKPLVVYPSPQGTLLTQEIIETLFHHNQVVIICGHYEGLDERFVERYVDIEVSVGDCVLTGGEIPAMAIVDAVSRLVPGVVGKSEAVENDSFYRGMLDHPHYTRPASWEGMDVPAVLVSGNAADIKKWRRQNAVERTLKRRPDLLSRSGLGGYIEGGFYVVLDSSVCSNFVYTEAELNELTVLCEGYGVTRLLVVAWSPANRDKLLGCVPEENFAKVFLSWGRALEWVKKKEKTEPLCVGLSGAGSKDEAYHWVELKRVLLERKTSVIFYPYAQGEIGFEPDVLMREPQNGRLSVIGNVAAILDRFMGC
ncbi:tRNA (guanine-N(1)-)-methyltransferase [Synergistales bacterium]|nr:tRNA (guanine-N(1)-)-methyltransferase [Synergistales bacterium]